jgi:hypothetical protein
MTIYSPSNYRKIYELHYGPIPVDDTGRTYEIHHIDGNHFNNDPTNLRAVTIQEHYDIHYSQGDYYACYLIATQRMNKTPEEISNLAKLNATNQVDNNTHPFLGSDLQKRRVEEGTHPFLGGEIQRKAQLKRVKEGKHHLVGDGSFQREVQAKRVEAGTHNFLGGNIAKKTALLRIDQGTHNFLGEAHPNKKKVTCSVCGKVTSPTALTRYHQH